MLKNRVSIDERLVIVGTRQCLGLGDREVRTIIGRGRRHTIVSLTDGKSRVALLRKVERKTAQSVTDVVIELLEPLLVEAHTMTTDKGKESADHEAIANNLNTNVYFAHPYSSWERATNENTTGRIRQYFRKKLNFPAITERETSSSWKDSTTDPENVLHSKHRIRYASFDHPLFHLEVERKKP